MAEAAAARHGDQIHPLTADVQGIDYPHITIKSLVLRDKFVR